MASSAAPVYMLVGDEDYLKKDWLSRLRQKKQQQAGQCELVVFDKERGVPDSATVFDELRTPWLFGGTKIVYVDPADEFVLKAAAPLLSYLRSPSPAGCLVLSLSNPPSDRQLAHVVKKMNGMVELTMPKRGDLVAWILDRVKDYGARLDSAAAALLAERIGERPGVLDNVLQRIIQQVGSDKPIRVADIEQQVPAEREHALYEISAAVAAANTATALQALHSLLLRETPAEVYRVLLTYLATYVSKMRAVRELLDKGYSRQDVQTTLGTPGAYFLVKEAAMFSNEDIDRMIEMVASCDHRLKTTGASEEVALEWLLVAMCNRSSRPATRPSRSR